MERVTSWSEILRRHHPFKDLVTLSKVCRGGIVVLVRQNNSIVRADLEHIFGALRLSAMDGKGVFLVIDSPPV